MSTAHEEIIAHVRRMHARSTPADDWVDWFRVVPPWWVMAPLVAMIGPFIVFDGLSRDVLSGTARAVKHHSWFWHLAKQPGEYWLTVVVALIIGKFHPWRWKGAGLLIAASALTGVLCAILKWTVGRRRPVTDFGPFELDLFRDGLGGFFKQSNLCFPSGHATLAFSTATILTLLLPRGWWLWFALATLCAMQRVAEMAHYPSDSLGAAIVGILGARLAVWICLVLAGQR